MGANQAGGDVQINNISMFRLDLMAGGGEGPASNWYAIRGGHQILHRTDKTTGSDQFPLQDGGDVEFAEVEVVGPFVSGGARAELLQVLNQWGCGKGQRFNSTLELLDSGQQVVRTINFFECVPTNYVPPSVRAGDDSLLEEKFSFKAERVEG